jgi:hypothetical protein
MLKDYPEHIERLQDALNVYSLKPFKLMPFDGAIWALEGRLETFCLEADAEMEAAKASNDLDRVAQAKAKQFAFSCARTDGPAHRHARPHPRLGTAKSEPSELSPELRERIFNEDVLPKYRLSEKTSLENPRAIILAGQPGAGKGTLSNAAKAELRGDVVTIDPAARRTVTDVAQAVERPVEQSLQRADALAQQQAQALAQVPNQPVQDEANRASRMV